jgi:IS605 OrfB family transposase
MIRAHKIRLHPTEEQKNYFARAAGTARFVWNWALAEWNRQYSASEKPTALALKKLRQANKRLHRRKLGSKNRERTRRQLARLHYRISCMREDVLHKLTTRIALSYGTVGIEDLNLQGLLKNRRLSRSLSDAPLGKLLALLKSKVEQRGG